MYLKLWCCHFLKDNQLQKMINVYQFHPTERIDIRQVCNKPLSQSLPPYYKNDINISNFDKSPTERKCSSNLCSYIPFQESPKKKVVNIISQLTNKVLSIFGYPRNSIGSYKSEFSIDKNRGLQGETTQFAKSKTKEMYEFGRLKSLQMTRTKTNKLKGKKTKISALINSKKGEPPIKYIVHPHLLNQLNSRRKNVQKKKYKKKKTTKSTLGSIPEEVQANEQNTIRLVKKNKAGSKQNNETKVNDYNKINEGTSAKVHKQLEEETKTATERRMEEGVDRKNKQSNDIHITKSEEQSQFKGDSEIKEKIMNKDYINSDKHTKIKQEISNDYNKAMKAMLSKLSKAKEEAKLKSNKQTGEEANLKADTKTTEKLQIHENKIEKEEKPLRQDEPVKEEIKFKSKQINVDAQVTKQSAVKNNKEIEEIKDLKDSNFHKPRKLELKPKDRKKKINDAQSKDSLLKQLAKKREMKINRLSGNAEEDLKSKYDTKVKEINKTHGEELDAQTQQETTIKEYEITEEDLKVKERKAIIYGQSKNNNEHKSLNKDNKNALHEKPKPKLRVKDVTDITKNPKPSN